MLRNRQVSCQTLLLVGLALLLGLTCGIAIMIGWPRLLPNEIATPDLPEPTIDTPPAGDAPASDISLDPTPPPYWDNVYVEYILDASGSMQDELDGVRKIEIALIGACHQRCRSEGHAITAV